MITDGIRLLMDKRGNEQITFRDVADHFADYLDRFPDETDPVDKLARFLAGVEDVLHDHDAGAPIGSDA
ncbi:MAG: DUF6104 family protein [Actinomycetota bacterium]